MPTNTNAIDEQALERELSGSLDNDPLAVLQKHVSPVPPHPALGQGQPRILEQSRNPGPAPARPAQPTAVQQPRPPANNGGPGGSAHAAEVVGNITPVRAPAPAPQPSTVAAGTHVGKTHMDAVAAEVQKERSSVKSQRANNITVTERNINHYNDSIELNEGARRVALDEQSARFDGVIATTQAEIARVQEYLERLNNNLSEETKLKRQVLAEIEVTFNDKHDDLLALRDSEQARLDVLKRQSIRDEQKDAKVEIYTPTENTTSGAVKSRIPLDHVPTT